MPEMSEERLAYLEALESVVTHIVLPLSIQANTDAEMERVWRFPNDLTDHETKNLMLGHAMWDDPPKGWSRKDLVLWSKGYLYGRAIVGGNFGQQFFRFVKALKDPIGYWRRWRLGYLDLMKYTKCSCGGTYKVDEERVGVACSNCHEFYEYEAVVGMVEKDMKSKVDESE